MEARNQVVKIEFKNDIRLVEIEDPNEGASILKSKISNLYSIPSNLIQLKVKDDDGDLITVESNADWRTVIRVVAKPRVLVMQEVSLVQASEVVGATLAKRQIKFNFKGNLIRIELNVERLEKLGLAHLGDGALSEKINQEWKLKELLRFGLAEGPQVIAAFTEVGLTPPPRFLHKLGEFVSDGSGPEMIHPHVLQEHSHKHFGFAHRGHHPHHPHPHHPHHPHPHHRFGRGFHHRQHFGHGAFHAEPVKEDDAPHSNANVEPTTQKLEELAVCDEHQSFWKGCRRSMVRFVKHVTIVDGEAVQVDTKINKMWRVRNDSNEPWPEQVELIHIGGDSFGFTAPVAVRGRVAPGTECDINVELIVPSKPGLHDGYFRLREVNGKRFGQRIWISVRAVTPTSDSEDYVLATPSEVAEFPDAESQLKEMGFVDSIRNRELLNRYRGNVERVVARLTNADGCQFAVATNDLE